MPAADVRVLGPIEVVGDDGPISLAGKHGGVLAALLVVDGRACDLDELIEALWGDSAPASARKLVQVYVSQLRKVLPEGVEIETRKGAYAASVPDGVLDADRFERLLGESIAAREAGNPALALSLADRALGLWRGRAYGELAYEEFARAESERLEELRSRAVEERIAALLDFGRHDDVLRDALAHAEKNSLSERAHELAMLALYRSGRQADALEHYAAFRAKLDEQLGLEPRQPLRELQRRILQQDPGLEPGTPPRSGAAALPAPPNELVGRDRELAELRELLERRESRLVVLTGAGGSGKTRLALEIARQTAASYANGAALVELAPLRDPALVVPAFARVLEVAPDPDGDPLDALVAALASQELLLVVDNAEHVRDAAPAFAELAARAPRTTILVTSRAVLHVSGEHVFPVAPLDDDSSIELFVQRARSLHPTFELGPGDVSDVREICRRVDRLPLAIELAAARIRTLTPRALLERLGPRLSVLTGGPRDLPARQQTLRETIDWSVGLLDERARSVFARLAVFPGGATLDAAEAVCGGDLDTLAALVDDHLVRRDDAHGESRFGMLETVREYALELLGDERAGVELALARYFAHIVEDVALPRSPIREWHRAAERLDPEVDNVRVSLAAAAGSGDAQLLLQLAGSLWRYWWVRGSPGEGLSWIERALAEGDEQATSARARALQGGAALAWSRGDNARARDLARAAIPVAVAVGSVWDEVCAYLVLGILANEEGDHATALEHYERSLQLSEQFGIEPLPQKLNIAEVVLASGDHETAITLFEDLLAAHRRNEDPEGIGLALLNLGLIHHELGDHEAARRDFEEARACFEELAFHLQLAYSLQGLAALEASRGGYEEAARLLGQARRLLDEVGSPWDKFAPEMIAATEAAVREALGDDAYGSALGASRDGPS